MFPLSFSHIYSGFFFRWSFPSMAPAFLGPNAILLLLMFTLLLFESQLRFRSDALQINICADQKYRPPPDSRRAPGHPPLRENATPAPWLQCHLPLSFVYSLGASFQSMWQHSCPSQLGLIFWVRFCKVPHRMDYRGPGLLHLHIPFIQSFCN